jgi:Flp pilus assembly protein TadG
MKHSPVGRSQSGQAMVETALTMPLFVFLVLGLLQMSLMHQARYMTKYAAYKAARTGSIHSAKKKAMVNAALGVLMPYVGQATSDLFYKTGTPTDYALSYKAAQLANLTPLTSIVDVTICDPTGNVTGDFDDPTSGMAVLPTNTDDPPQWQQFNKGRLSVQVTFNFKLVIPFANMLIWKITAGLEDANTMRVMRMGNKLLFLPTPGRTIISKLGVRAAAKNYFIPIRNGWSMRMMSNFLPDFPLPGANDCLISWTKGT